MLIDEYIKYDNFFVNKSYTIISCHLLFSKNKMSRFNLVHMKRRKWDVLIMSKIFGGKTVSYYFEFSNMEKSNIFRNNECAERHFFFNPG